MKYAYEELSSSQFEELVVLICQELLGLSVQGFAAGRDGGRDAKFIGKAQLFPSTTAPWEGAVIIQAKHTEGYNKSFSETDFFSPESSSCILAEELPKIIELRKNKELNHYMLFANRKLTALASFEIQNHIATHCDLPVDSIYLCGVEQLELWLKRFSHIPQIANIDPVDSPLHVSPEDLAEVVEALGKKIPKYQNGDSPYPTPRVSYKEKNKINKMSEDYAKALRKNYLKETAIIQDFLSDPENDTLKKLYEDTATEFQLNIIAKRKDYQHFDCVMNHLTNLLFSRDPILRSKKRLTRAMLFYMYWNCDIGLNKSA